ncbi:MAG: carboxypeptidase regulatory-like domain-containing protein [Planctomycetaceae bacterium]|nr:carboxypeptidase regulatory-like domain-containing protein [Planctomycetaceae bacterium]
MNRFSQRLLSGMLCFALVAPHPAIAESSADSADTQQPIIRDVELAEGGVARGLVVTSAGQPASGVKVALHVDDEVYAATADENGQFAVEGLRGGSCVVQVGETVYGARFWANGTAPPQALHTFVVVNQDGPVVRGGSGGSKFPTFKWPKGFGHLNPLSGLTHKQLLALGIGAGVAGATIAIILAIQDDGDASN